jgi:hypothetical protein
MKMDGINRKSDQIIPIIFSPMIAGADKLPNLVICLWFGGL